MSVNTRGVDMSEVWLVQDQESMQVVGIYSTRDKAIEASSKYIASFEAEGSVKVNIKVLALDE